ncbi:MAG TPA: HD domain-containing phosphohydrolase [Gemmatimonadales bacterium]|nr:HD domain-containing phosphohydrolase [Gemmatimonadales bacterium]
MTQLAALPPGVSRRPAAAEACRAAVWLDRARKSERAGAVAAAIEQYRTAIAEGERSRSRAVVAEALRRLSVLHHHRGEAADARELCERSFALARELGDDVLGAEALNTLAGFEFETGAIDAARRTYRRALELGGHDPSLGARVEQNLGILANIQGDLAAALAHYRRSLEAYRAAGDEKGLAIAYHNLGMVSADRGLWEEADRYFTLSLAAAERLGELHLRGLCLLNHAEVHLAREDYERARMQAETALSVFDQLGARLDKADVYRVLGVVYRETGHATLAESRLRAALELAVETGSILSEAEAARELARLYQGMGRNQDALQLLNRAHRLFRRLDARVDTVDVAAKMARLEETYLTVVREWGQSIESADGYTHGHCERVAAYALQVARALGLDEQEQRTIRLGAYLHDVGKVRVPHEILNKPGPLTREELETMQMHPVWGIELLAGVEFPWDIKPIIRWHHEKYDGSGYPDRLRGDEIPLGAQIIGIVDVYDALTTTRSYRPAMSREAALEQMRACRSWWRPDVFEALMRSVVADPSGA